MGLLLVRLCSLSRPRRKTELLLKSKSLFAFAVLDSHPVAIFVKSAISCLPPCLMLSVTFCQVYAVLSHFLERDSSIRKNKQPKPAQDWLLCNIIFPRTFKDSCSKGLDLFSAGFSDPHRVH